MSFEMTSAQKEAFQSASAGAVSTSNATEMIALVVSFFVIAWLLLVFMGYSKKLVHRQIDILDLVFPLSVAVLVITIVGSILFS